MQGLLGSFRDPPPKYRPLQVIHDFSHYRQRGLRPEDLVDLLVQRGCGGVVTNVAWGHDYLGSDLEWELLRRGIELLKQNGLRVWIYDEKGYPSGVAGGQVLRDHPEWRAQGVYCIARKAAGEERLQVDLPAMAENWVYCVAVPVEGRLRLDAALPVAYHVDAPVVWSAPPGKWLLLCFATRRLLQGTIAGSKYGWADGGYINLLTKEAVAEFCALTHHRYAERLGELWPCVEAVFTDEPALQSAYVLFDEGQEADRGRDSSLQQFIDSSRCEMDGGTYPPTVVWESRLPEWFRRQKGYAVERVLPALFIDFPGAHRLRYDYYDVVSQTVANSYLGTIRSSCECLGIASSGHLLAEDFLHQHVVFEGDLYRSLRQFHIPGIDILVGKPETIANGHMFMIPKIASSVAHICGAPSTLIEHWDFCERYGFLDPWPLSMEERLGTLGLVFALGVDCLASYMPFVPIGGPLDERLEPRVPRQSDPMGAEYRRWTDCAGRLSQLVSGGLHVCDIVVYYPIEGIQACLLPCGAFENQRQTNPVIKYIEDTWIESCRSLVQAQWDFDVVDDQALTDALLDEEDGCLRIGSEAYHAVVLTHTPFIPLRVLKVLAAFVEHGGKLITVGPYPGEATEWERDTDFLRCLGRVRTGETAHTQNPADVAALVSDILDPDTVVKPRTSSLVGRHIRHPDRETYVLVNTSSLALDLEMSFSTSGTAHLLWPADGTQQLLQTTSCHHFRLAGYGTAAVVFPT